MRVSADPWSFLGRWLAQNNQHPKSSLTGQLPVAPVAKESHLPVLQHALLTVTITDGKCQSPQLLSATSSQQILPATRENPEDAYLEIVLQGRVQAWGMRTSLPEGKGTRKHHQMLGTCAGRGCSAARDQPCAAPRQLCCPLAPL